MANAAGFINPRVAATAAGNKATAAIPTTIDELADVDTSTTPATDGQVLTSQAGLWIPQDIPPATAPPIAIDDLTDVDTTTTAPADGDLLRFDVASGTWKPHAPAASSATNLDGLTDVDTSTTAPADGDLLRFDVASGTWKPHAPAAPGATNLDGLTDVDTTTTAPADGQILRFDAASGLWKPHDPTSAGWTAITVPNGGAESGVTGWTMAGGGFTAELANPAGHVMVPVEGTHAFVASANATPTMQQDIDVSAHATLFDTGAAEARLQASGCFTFTDIDHIEAALIFLDGSGNPLTALVSGYIGRSLGQGTWYEIVTQGFIPVGTRKFRVNMCAVRTSGTNNNTAVDKIRLYYR